MLYYYMQHFQTAQQIFSTAAPECASAAHPHPHPNSTQKMVLKSENNLPPIRSMDFSNPHNVIITLQAQNLNSCRQCPPCNHIINNSTGQRPSLPTPLNLGGLLPTMQKSKPETTEGLFNAHLKSIRLAQPPRSIFPPLNLSLNPVLNNIFKDKEMPIKPLPPAPAPKVRKPFEGFEGPYLPERPPTALPEGFISSLMDQLQKLNAQKCVPQHHSEPAQYDPEASCPKPNDDSVDLSRDLNYATVQLQEAANRPTAEQIFLASKQRAEEAIDRQIKQFEIKHNQDKIKKAEKAKQRRIEQKLAAAKPIKEQPQSEADILLILPSNLSEALFASYVDQKKDSNYVKAIKPEETKTEQVETPASQEQSDFVCKYCPMKFKICSALGGHVSKAHPGQSEAYEHKKRVRDTRQLERDLHQDAVQIFKERAKATDVDLNRNTIKRIKKEIVKNEKKYEILRDKFIQKIDH